VPEQMYAMKITAIGDAMTAVDTTTFRVLIAGPDAADNPVGTVVLALGRHFALIRAVDSPEVIVRDAGTIDVK